MTKKKPPDYVSDCLWVGIKSKIFSRRVRTLGSYVRFNCNKKHGVRTTTASGCVRRVATRIGRGVSAISIVRLPLSPGLGTVSHTTFSLVIIIIKTNVDLSRQKQCRTTKRNTFLGRYKKPLVFYVNEYDAASRSTIRIILP